MHARRLPLLDYLTKVGLLHRIRLQIRLVDELAEERIVAVDEHGLDADRIVVVLDA